MKKVLRTTLICLTAAAISHSVLTAIEWVFKSDREIVIRHVIDISPITKKK